MGGTGLPIIRDIWHEEKTLSYVIIPSRLPDIDFIRTDYVSKYSYVFTLFL